MAFYDDIDLVSRFNGLGNLTSAQTNNFQGLNHRGMGNPIPRNKDNAGMTFFTRPRLNLSYDNLIQNRILSLLLTRNDMTIQRAIRVLLDSELVMASNGAESTPLVDDSMAFIPLLTNNLISISGWPDIAVDTYSSKEGMRKEAWSMVDGTAMNYGIYQLNASFRNMPGDPITLLFAIWALYSTLVYQGEITARPDSIVEREIDYMTRVYRLTLDPSRRYVQKIACCGVAFPLSAPVGAAFNYTEENVYSQDTDQISMGFQAMGFCFYDPIIIEEFNATVTLFNTGMLDRGRSSNYHKLTRDETLFFNYQGYPRIDPETMELEWWVDKAMYEELLGNKQTAKTE